MTPFREVVDHDGIERHYNDARHLYDRRHNSFKVHGYDKVAATGYVDDFIPAALLLAVLAAAIVSMFIFG